MSLNLTEYQISSWWEEFSSPELGSYDLDSDQDLSTSNAQLDSVNSISSQAITDEIIRHLFSQAVSSQERQLLKAILSSPTSFEIDFLKEKLGDFKDFMESLFDSGDVLLELTPLKTILVVLLWDDQIFPIDVQKIIRAIEIKS